MLPLPRLGARYGVELLLKDDGLLPTASFKARGAAVGVSRAKELGIAAFAMPTNGNAGGAWAAYAARAGLAAHLVMPRDAPHVNRLEAVMTGARAHLVDGLISDAGKIVARASPRTAGSTPRRSRSRTASKARKRWASSSPSSSAGTSPT